MRLFHFHRWTAWERIQIRIVHNLGGHIAEGEQDEQERFCTVCGRIQRAELW